MKTLSIDPAILTFAAAVRDALDDLPADDIDDLTDGLEADLNEQAADGGPALADPVAYADELRAAAGLAPRAAAGRAPLIDLALVRANLRHAPDDLARAIRSRPGLSAIADLLISMRPVWWTIRGLVLVGALTIEWLANSAQRVPLWLWIAASVGVVVSVQWGRGRWLPTRGRRAIPFVASVIAVLAIIPLYIGVTTYVSRQFAEVYSGTGFEPTGLQLDGTPITNVFAYGPDGELLTDVQLFDQDGSPLSVVGADHAGAFMDGYTDEGYFALAPRDSAPGAAGWNVFPLVTLDPQYFDEGGLPSVNNPTIESTPPFERAQPLVGAVTSDVER